MTIRSVTPRTPMCSTSSAILKASAKVVFSLAILNRFWLGMTISVSTTFSSSSDALLGRLHAAAALEVERLGDDADGQDALLARRRGDDGRRTGAGAAAHAGGDEHHVGAVEQLQDLRQRLFGRLAADLGPRAGAQALGDGDAELDAAVGQRLAERLRVGVGDDEFHAFQRGADHVVDGVSARATDADDGDARLNLGLRLRETEVDCHYGSLHANEGVICSERRRGPRFESKPLHRHRLFLLVIYSLWGLPLPTQHIA